MRARPDGPNGDERDDARSRHGARGAAIVEHARHVDHTEVAPGHAERGEPVCVGRLPPKLAHRGRSDEHDARHDGDEREHEQRSPFEIDDPAHGRRGPRRSPDPLVEPPFRRRLVQRRVERRPGGAPPRSAQHAGAVAGEAATVPRPERRAGEDVLVAGNGRVRQAPRVVGLHVVEGTHDADDLRRERRQSPARRAVDRRVQIGLGPTRHAHRCRRREGRVARAAASLTTISSAASLLVRAPVQDDRSAAEAPRTRADAREQRQAAPVVRRPSGRAAQRPPWSRPPCAPRPARGSARARNRSATDRIRALRDEIGFTFDGVRIARRAGSRTRPGRNRAACARRSARATCRPRPPLGTTRRSRPRPSPTITARKSDARQCRRHAVRTSIPIALIPGILRAVCTNPVRPGSLPAGGRGVG